LLEDRAYQGNAERAVLWHLHAGSRPLLVSPTGSGKSKMATAVISQLPGRTAWLTHTRDLVSQSAAKAREYGLRVGIVAAGHEPDPLAPLQVVSIQTLIAREVDLRVENVFADEAHHLLSTEWRAAMENLRAQNSFGATATPERGDGRPLGDLFDKLVVAAHYSELIAGGYLVPLRILRPDTELARGLAMKPVESYLKHGERKRGFWYLRSIKEALETATLAAQAGIRAGTIDESTPKPMREHLLRSLAAERGVEALTNVYALTEGIDVPSAELCMLARNFRHMGTMLQAVGRVLRPAPCKNHAMLLDLPGTTWRLGIPVEDKEYSLSGEPIRKSEKALALRVCMKCGMTFVAKGDGSCPRCGHRNVTKDPAKLRIYNKELAEVYAAGGTPDWAKRSEYDRLKRVAGDRGLPPSWVAHQYKELFGHAPPELRTADETERRAEYSRLKALAEKKGMNVGWAAHRYRALYGAFPPRGWASAEVVT